MNDAKVRELVERLRKEADSLKRNGSPSAAEGIATIADELESALASAPEWIACSERMPATDELALVYFPDLGVQAVAWSKCAMTDSFEWCVDDNKNGPQMLRGWLAEPTHWMPLPSAPKVQP